MSETEVNNIFQDYIRHASLDVYIDESESTTLADTLEAEDHKNDSDMKKESLKKEIRRVLKLLNPREAEIVNAYFGLDGENGLTIDQIGQKYDLTKERIRQIKERAIKRMQMGKRSNTLQKYLG